MNLRQSVAIPKKSDCIGHSTLTIYKFTINRNAKTLVIMKPSSLTNVI